VLLVAAAGNAAQQGNPTQYPAALIGDSGLVVGAADALGRRAAFSTTGPYVDLLAPGVGVLGALAAGRPRAFFAPVAMPGLPGTYGLGTGTSYAAPEVAGAAALVMAANPFLDAAGVAGVITTTASRRSHDLDVAAAVDAALGG
jgi:membrane-anchored mycosin MYCP